MTPFLIISFLRSIFEYVNIAKKKQHWNVLLLFIYLWVSPSTVYQRKKVE